MAAGPTSRKTLCLVPAASEDARSARQPCVLALPGTAQIYAYCPNIFLNITHSLTLDASQFHKRSTTLKSVKKCDVTLSLPHVTII